MSKAYILQLPFDIISDISEYLDLCSRTCLMDTCRRMRYLFLSSRHLWKRIVFDIRLYNMSKIYSSLRKLSDTNGLRECIQEVVMDDCDDPDISPLVMLIKFPNLKNISAVNRKNTTQLLVDTKLLQEMLLFEKIKPKSLPLQSISIHHYFMDYENYLDAYQLSLNRISKSQVQLDIKTCGYVEPDSELDQLEQEVNSLNQRIQSLELQPETPPVDLAEVERCKRIIKLNARCWSCGHVFDTCWKCTPKCDNCNIKRIPPAANDNQIRIKSRKAFSSTTDDFSVFE